MVHGITLYVVVWGLLVLNHVFVNSSWTCDYYLPDSNGLTMNKIVYLQGIGWSLHGAWNNLGNDTEPCLTYDQFIVIYHKRFIEGDLIHFVDSSPKTHHTCCVGQWHEYLKHGCRAGNSFKNWNNAINYCLTNFDPKKMYVHRCRYDSHLGCNYVDEVSNTKLEVYDCRQDKPFCSDFCFEDHHQSMCSVRGMHVSRPYYYSVKFKFNDNYSINPYVETPNCHCFINPVSKVMELADFELLPPDYDSRTDVVTENVTEFEVLSPEVTTNSPERERETITPILQNDIPVLKCTCVNNTVEFSDVDETFIEENKKALDWYIFKPKDRYLLQELVSDFKIFCYNYANKLKQLPPVAVGEFQKYSKDTLGHYRNILVGNAKKNEIALGRF